jgi:CHAT domain-containing protein/Tfp pilus assembly protein PilF
MTAVARMLALPTLVAALACPAAAQAEQSGAEALAERLLRAREAERRQILADPGFGSVELARTFAAIGEKARVDAQYPRALLAFEAAESLARRAGAEKEVGQALGGTADVLYLQGELARALEAARESLRVREGLGDAAEQALAWNMIGKIRAALAEYADALASYQKALDLWTAAGDRRSVARALNNIGTVHNVRSDYDQALGHYEQALRTFEEIGERRFAAIVTNNIGFVHFHRGEYPQALEYCTRSLAMQEALGDPVQIGGSLSCLGNIHRDRGSYAHAIDLFHRILKLSQEVGHKWLTIEAWNNLGLVYFAQGDYRLAIDAYKRSLRLNKEMGGTTNVPDGLMNIAAAAWRLGELRRAEANYRESLRASERMGSRAMVANNLHDLGRMALEAGRHPEAGRLLKRALEVREAVKDQYGIAEALNGLAALRLAAGRPGEALDLTRRSAEIARTFKQPELRWEAETLSGIAYRRLGQTEAARRSFHQAVEVIEGLRLQVVGRAQGRERFFESKLSPYHELMALALAGGAASEALELAERSKARALADLVQSGRVDVSGAMSEEDRREEARLRAALVSRNRRLQAERARETPDAGLLASLEAERQAKRSAYEAFQTAVYARLPDLQVKRGGAAPFTFAEAYQLLPDASVAVLEYAVTEEATYLFVLTRDQGIAKLRSYRLATGRRSLAPLARRLRERLAVRELSYAQDARRLHDLLLAPARPALRGRTHLVVVPDGPLWDVPFQALMDASGRYVIESAAVSYAPSLTVLREALGRPTSGSRRTLLAMGKADFGAKGARPALSLMSELAPLPEAERQVRLIGGLYGPDRSSTYLGLEAREDRFKAEAPRHAVLHLATHGVLEEGNPLYSHVVLSPGPAGSPEDGLLEAWEMLDLKLDAELVVLSACETGRGRIAPGEGIVGTMWAFFVAGSRAVLVSQWKVESASTTELMTGFHRRLAGAGGGKAEHLRQASLEVLRTPRYAHPFYWAGFVLVGDPY